MLRIALLGEMEGVHEKRFLRAFSERGIDSRFISISSIEEDPAILKTANQSHRFDLVIGGPLQHARAIRRAVEGISYIATSYAYDVLLLAQQNKKTYQEIQALIPSTKGFLVDCEAVREELVSMGAQPSNILVAAWGLESRGVHTTVPESTRQTISTWRKGDSKIIICVRNFTTLHGVEQVIRSFHHALQSAPTLKIILTGAGPLQSHLEQLITDLDLQSSIELTGNLSEAELRALFDLVDLYVSASLVDGTSISLLQALDSGLPVCLSRVGGNLEWAERTSGAFLFNTGDILALSDLMLSCSNSAPQRFDRVVELDRHANWQKNADIIAHFCHTKTIS